MPFDSMLTATTSDGLSLHVHRRAGAGPALLLAHGITGHGGTWEGLLDDLPPSWDVLAPDARGHGRSGRAPAYRYQDLATDVVAALDGAGVSQTALLGHSMGAATVAVTAARSPDRVRCVVLEDPPWRLQERPAEARRKRATAWREELEVQQQGTVAQRMAVLAEMRPAWTEAERRACAEAERATDPAVMDLVAHGAEGWQEVLGQVSCPLLLVCGDPSQGAIVTPEAAARARQLHDGVEVTVIEGAGHNVHRDGGRAYAEAVVGFLQRHLP